MSIRIPALLSGTADALGNPITNPAGYVCNGSECTVIQTDSSLTTDPFWASVGVLIKRTQAEVIAADTGDASLVRVAEVSPNVLDVITLSAAQTGDDLAETNAYIAKREA